MTRKPFIVDASCYDLNTPIATLEDIRQFNHQRFEMERLTAVVYENAEDKTCVGYNDLPPDDFWIRGHMPGRPLLPGVLMCEAAAQLASYYVTKNKFFGDGVIMGFAGLEEVKFRGMVHPGDRLVLQGELLKLKRILVISRFMCIVGDEVVCEGIIKGVPLPAEVL